MSVLVDTSIWSTVLRRRARRPGREADELTELIRQGRVAMIGPVRQELLSGLGTRTAFNTLRDHLRPFPDLPLESEDYENAAVAANSCRRRGIQGSPTDFLICAVARRRNLAIFTADKDFARYSEILALKLHQPARAG